MSAIPNFMAFWRPAIYQNDKTYPYTTLKADQMAIYMRIAIITTTVAALTLRSLSHSQHATVLKLSSFKVIFSIAMIAFMYVWNKCEHLRATWKLDQLAIQLFKENDSLPFNVQQYLEIHPSAVKRLVSEVDRDSLPQKVTHGKESSLLGRIIRNGFFGDSDSEKATWFEIFKLLIDHGVPLITKNFNYFLYALETGVPHFAMYALETKKIKPEDLTADQQIACWTQLRDDLDAQALINYGFDINVKNKDQLTPLLWTILYASPQCTNYPKTRRITFLLANGASLPDAHMQIRVPKKENGKTITEEISLIKYLEASQPEIKNLFKQCLDHKKQSAPSQSHSGLAKSYPSTFAIWKPAIAISSFDDDFFGTFDVGYQIKERTRIVAFATFVTLAIVAMKTLKSLPYALPLIALPSLYYKIEKYRATKTLDNLALQEYQTMFPRHTVLKYILQREPLIDQLIAKKIILTKRDRGGNSFFRMLNFGYGLERLNFERRLALVQQLASTIYSKTFNEDELNKYFPDLMKLRSKL